ncbi:NAD(P)-binding protein [Calocera cornea HHB12733]|uniref:NAD(P)-binding protein n=1 Tax=Calocera cornea HHB12733 TaxID=1353952 RepID=A0A165CW31_9BASI|nr:NAD(P)-binding protein [Calocera cornea HHB12733]
MSTQPKVWLITGACTGFGLIMTKLVLAGGDKCVATSIDPPALRELEEQYGSSKLLSLHVDVTRPEEITAAFNAAKDAFGGVDVVLNNAGLGLSGVVEAVPEATAKKLFDVNFWGSTSVTKESVRFFRDVNGPERGGKLMVMSSAAGIGAPPFMGYYSASKHAVEAITTSVSKEIKPEWKIQIMLVEPGWFATALLLNRPADLVVPTPEVYGGAAAIKSLTATIHPGDPKKAMELVHRIAQKDKLPFHLPIGPAPIYLAKTAASEWGKVAEEWEEEAQKPEYGPL